MRRPSVTDTVLKSLKLALALTFVSNIVVEPFRASAAVGVAEEEAVRRQQAAKQLAIKLEQAEAEQNAGKIVAASVSFQEAVGLIPKIGLLASEETEARKKRAIAGLVDCSVQLARQAQGKGDFREASVQLDRALNADPSNTKLIAAKQANDKQLEAQRGRVPSEETVALGSEVKETRISVDTLVQDGVWLMEAGKNAEAKAKFQEALKIDPGHKAGFHYLNLIKEREIGLAVRDRVSNSAEGMIEIEKAWNPNVKREQLQVPNPMVHTNLIHSSAGRQRISLKLQQIRMKEVSFDGVPLPEVLRQLRVEAKNSDPEGRGINFMINPKVDAASPIPDIASALGAIGGTGAGGGGGGAGRGGFGAPSDPAFGGVPGDPNDPSGGIQAEESVDINTVTVRIDPPLTDLSLAEVLDAVISVADHPIRYRIDDYAVVFQPKAVERQALLTRTFKVDPNTFSQGLEGVTILDFSQYFPSDEGGGQQQNTQSGAVSFGIPRIAAGASSQGGGGGGANGESVGLRFVTGRTNTLSTHELVRLYFTAAGVDLAPPKAVFFNDRKGILMVRAAAQDLEVIQSALEVLNEAPPQVTIEAKFTEINQTDSKALGFDWYLGNFILGNSSVGAQGGTAPSSQAPGTTANGSGIFPGPGDFLGNDAAGNPVYSPGAAQIASQGTDGLLSGGLRNTFGGNNNSAVSSTPTVATITGILTDPQFRVAIRALEQRGGADILTAPKVTTLSGRQAQIAILDLQTVVVDTTIEGGTETSTEAGVASSSPTLDYVTQPIPFGPTLDVIPYVSADGYSIQMTIVPTVSEFLGYDDPGQFVPSFQAISSGTIGVPVTARLPLPKMRTRHVTTSCVVWDGQTVVIGGLITEDIRKIKDKIPVLGDVPLFGRLFRSESSSTAKKNLYIFVTPTIIDPAGNRVHNDDDLPFAQAKIPQQPR